ncbi:hypothetical protein SCLCIDRAFT_27433 [Scleroderma citrinum Foug A]|uniref:Uncharacterized protein n=1 Tax=Scleroderma citrinum Foug A TaxID=1036808 RepID=A0A0C3DF44_9AGAM|nr:hypothetical protein SCLCIDRAFT_27433 [Scleroderma citrinum Foug A]
MSSTWNPGPVRSLPLSPVLNLFVTPPHAPARNVTPGRAVTPDHPLPSQYPPLPCLPLKSAGSSIMGAIDIQVTVTKILYKDYGNALIDSFCSFLGRKEAELEIRNQSFRRGFDSKAWTGQMEELAQFARKGMREADYLLKHRTPAFRRMMNRARVSLSISPSLARHLTADGEISYSLSDSPLPELTPSAPNTPSLRSLTPCSFHSQLAANFTTSSPAVESSPMLIPLADIGVSAATPSDTGPLTMTKLVSQYMEDLLTREFCQVPLDEEMLNEDI